MNNSLLAIEYSNLSLEDAVDRTPTLREREAELIQILSAIQGVASSKEWSSLKEKVFDNLTTTLEKEIKNEAQKENPDTLKLNRLAGQLKWAEKYSDLSKLERIFRGELTNVRKLLYGKS